MGYYYSGVGVRCYVSCVKVGKGTNHDVCIIINGCLVCVVSR